MACARALLTGVQLELSGSAVYATLAGGLLELGQGGLVSTLAGALLEVGQTGARATLAGALLEAGEIRARVTLAGAYLELEGLPASRFLVDGQTAPWAAYPDYEHPPILGPCRLEGEIYPHPIRGRAASPGRSWMGQEGLRWWHHLFGASPYRQSRWSQVSLWDPEASGWISGCGYLARPSATPAPAGLYQEVSSEIELSAVEAEGVPPCPPLVRVTLVGIWLDEVESG